ncbi:acyl carrier protein [Rhodococcoides fascians A25f]|uniref:acyl carrier protein n=1 Tax=Rhodococcoides fascians TaxID=1828 RepID=UPI000559E841|nr:acyl carrier protein [Rhodococcus fascians]QII04310.1 acyl carrier protein [Rhodococcus fascians A25f]
MDRTELVVRVEDVQEWLLACVARLARRSQREIAVDVPIVEYGLDSVSAVTLTVECEDHFGVEIDPAELWDHPTVDALAARVHHLVAAAR